LTLLLATGYPGDVRRNRAITVPRIELKHTLPHVHNTENAGHADIPHLKGA